MSEKTVLAVDPGTSKSGIALVHRNLQNELQLLHHVITPTDSVISGIHRAYAIEPFSLIIVGGGTGSAPVVHSIRENFTSMGLLVVDEKDTTMEARERYWEFNPRKGWRRFVPSSMQVPPEPVDDYAAYILAERVLLEG